MPHLRHKRQRRWHELRYGLKHWAAHRRGLAHTHARRRRKAAPHHNGASAPRSGTSTGPEQPSVALEPATGPSIAAADVDPEVRRAARRRRTRRRRAIWLAVSAVAVILVLLAISAVISLLDARHALDRARAAMTELTRTPEHLLTAQKRAQTRQLINQVSSLTRQAQDDLQSSPGVTAMWIVPYLHSQRAALLRLTSDVQATAASGRQLLAGVDRLAAQSHGTTISLSALTNLQHAMAVAEARQAPLTHWSSGLLPLLPPIESAQQSFVHADDRLTGLLTEGQRAATYAQAFLGGKGPRTYLLTAENNAEMRDQGAVLSYGLITADAGTLHVESPSTIHDLTLSSPANYPIPSGMQEVFGAYQPTLTWQSTNATAGFPWSGGDMQAMYAQATGQHVDGVVAMDVPTLASLLKLTGPVQVPGISQPVTAQNLAPIVLNQLYAGYPPGSSQAGRREVLSSVAKATVQKMDQTHVDVAALADALAHDVAGRHLLLWDDVPANQATIAKLGASGAVDTQDPSRSFHVAVEDGSANKLDYYVHVSQTEQVVVTPSNNAYVTTRITMKNTAPVGAGPSYVLGPDNVNTFTPGEYIARVYLWGPRGATQYGSVPESGLQVAQTTQEVDAGQTKTVQFTTEIHNAVRNGHLRLVFVPQPRLQPVSLTVHLVADGWTHGGPSTISAPLTKTRSWSWAFAR